MRLTAVQGSPNEAVLRDFLDNACPDHRVRGRRDHVRAESTAMRLLERHPWIATASLPSAIVCGELALVQQMPRDDLVRHEAGSKGWEPLLYEGELTAN